MVGILYYLLYHTSKIYSEINFILNPAWKINNISNSSFSSTLLRSCLHMALLFQVKILAQNENSRLQAALVSNLKSAVIASFLMLPESFSEEDLFLQIAGLSYSGESGGSQVPEKSWRWSLMCDQSFPFLLWACSAACTRSSVCMWLCNSPSNWVYSQEIGAAASAVLPVPAWFLSTQWQWLDMMKQWGFSAVCMDCVLVECFKTLGKKIFLCTQSNVESSDSLTHSLSCLFECAVFEALS